MTKKTCGPGKHTGNPCTKCGARGRGRPPGKKSAAAKPAAAAARKKQLHAGEAVSARLAATLGAAAPTPAPLGAQGGPGAAPGGEPSPPPAATLVPAVPDTLEPIAPETPTWCRSAGKRLAKVFVAGTEFALEKFGREANEPDDDDVDDFGGAVGRQLAVWFPDSELTPAKQMMLSGSLIVGAMCIGSKKIPPKRETIGTDDKPDAPSNGAPAADTTSNVTPLRA